MSSRVVKPARKITARCRVCTAYKHTQCDRIFDSAARCPCPCYDGERTAFWALIETARYWPHVIAARSAIAGSLIICWRNP